MKRKSGPDKRQARVRAVARAFQWTPVSPWKRPKSPTATIKITGIAAIISHRGLLVCRSFSPLVSQSSTACF